MPEDDKRSSADEYFNKIKRRNQEQTAYRLGMVDKFKQWRELLKDLPPGEKSLERAKKAADKAFDHETELKAYDKLESTVGKLKRGEKIKRGFHKWRKRKNESVRDSYRLSFRESGANFDTHMKEIKPAPTYKVLSRRGGKTLLTYDDKLYSYTAASDSLVEVTT